MADTNETLPEGFTLEPEQPDLPEGFALEADLPAGFKLEEAPPPEEAEPTEAEKANELYIDKGEQVYRIPTPEETREEREARTESAWLITQEEGFGQAGNKAKNVEDIAHQLNVAPRLVLEDYEHYALLAKRKTFSLDDVKKDFPTIWEAARSDPEVLAPGASRLYDSELFRENLSGFQVPFRKGDAWQKIRDRQAQSEGFRGFFDQVMHGLSQTGETRLGRVNRKDVKRAEERHAHRKEIREQDSELFYTDEDIASGAMVRRPEGQPYTPEEEAALYKDAETPKVIARQVDPNAPTLSRELINIAKDSGLLQAVRQAGASDARLGKVVTDLPEPSPEEEKLLSETFRSSAASAAYADWGIALAWAYRRGDDVEAEDILALQDDAYAAGLMAPPTSTAGGRHLGLSGEILQGVHSSAGSLAAGGGGALIGAGVGAAIAAIPVPGTSAAGAVVTRLGFAVGSSQYSFRHEFGSYLMSTEDQRTEDGQEIPVEVRLATGLLYAGMASSIELAGDLTFGLGALGPLGAMIKKGNTKAFAKAALRHPGLKKGVASIVGMLKAGGKSAFGEGIEEGSQQGVQGGVENIAAKLTDGHGNPLDLWKLGENVATSVRVGSITGLGMGAASHAAGGVASAPLRMRAAAKVAAQKSQIHDHYNRSIDSVTAITGYHYLMETEEAQAEPKAASEIAAREAKLTAAGIESFYIDPTAIAAKFAEDGLDPVQRVRELLGDEAAQSFVDSLETGTKFEIPRAEYNKVWMGEQLHKTFEADTANTPTVDTMNELTERFSGRGVDLAKETADEAIRQEEAEEGEQDEGPKAEFVEGLAEKFVAAGAEPGTAESAEDLGDAITRVAAKRAGIAMDVLFGETELKVASRGYRDAAILGKIREGYSTKTFQNKQQLAYSDGVTGLLNEAGDALRQRDPERTYRTVFSIPGFKAINDFIGHEEGNGVLRTVAAVVAKHIPDASKHGGDIVADVKSPEQAQAIAEEITAAIDKEGRFPVLSSTVEALDNYGATLGRAMAQAKTDKEKARESGKWAHRKSLPPAFHPGLGLEEIDFDTDDTVEGGKLGFKSEEAQKRLKKGAEQFRSIIEPLSSAERSEPILGAGHKDAFEADPNAAFRATFLRPSGLLNDQGDAAAAELMQDAPSASLDIREFAAINDAFERGRTDRILAFISRAMANMGGGQFNASHPSGDEFRARSYDREGMETFLKDWQQQSDRYLFYLDNGDGTVTILSGLTFAVGTGETFAEADKQALPAAKRKQDYAGQVSKPRIIKRAELDGVLRGDDGALNREQGYYHPVPVHLLTGEGILGKETRTGGGRRQGGVKSDGAVPATQAGGAAARVDRVAGQTERESDGAASDGTNDRAGMEHEADALNALDQPTGEEKATELADENSPSADAEATRVARDLEEDYGARPAYDAGRAGSQQEAFTALLEPIGGQDGSPSSVEDGQFREHRRAKAERSKQRKKAKRALAKAEKQGKAPKKKKKPTKKAASVPLPKRPPPYGAGTFDAYNEHLDGQRKVSGAFEAFQRIVGDNLNWDSEEIAKFIELSKDVPGMETITYPDEVQKILADRDIAKKQFEHAQDEGLIPPDVKFEELNQTKKQNPKNLLVVHNLSAENILAADELGGLPVPSLSVSRVETPIEGFGEISLVGGPKLIDPEGGTPTFDTDVYSPRFPRTGQKTIPKGMKALRKELTPFAEQLGMGPWGLKDILEEKGIGGVFANSNWSAVLGLAWLNATGKKVPTLETRPVNFELGLAEMPAMQEFYNTTKINDIDGSIYSEGSTPVSDKLVAAIRKAQKEWADTVDAESAEGFDRYFGEDGKVKSRISTKVLRDMRAVEAGPQQDHGKMLNAVEEAIHGTRDDSKAFRKWAGEKLEPVVGEKYIAKYVDHYANGPQLRRIPLTLQNVVKELTGKIKQQETDSGLGAVRSAGAKKFKTIAQIQKARDRITSPQEFEDAVIKYNNEHYYPLMDALDEYAPKGTSVDRSLEHAISDSYKRGNYMGKALKDNGFKNVPADIQMQAVEAANALLEMPTKYFEAKPQRAVAFSEFSAAVVPDGTDKRAIKVLEDAGLEIYYFDSMAHGERDDAFRDASSKPDILFQDGKDQTRGALQIFTQGTKKAFKLFLSQHADKSTPFHEMAHLYYEMLENIVQGRSASGDKLAGFTPPKNVVKDFENILEFMGAKDAESVTEEQKETFARAFEAYLREGKAPSTRLVATFQRIRLWLLNIYRTIAPLQVELDDNIRGVFDRMLATDEEIADMRRKVGLDAPAHDKATAGAYAKVQREILETQRRATSSEWNDAVMAARPAAAEEYEARPDVRAKAYLKEKDIELGTADRQVLDDVAEMFGYATADELTEAINETPGQTSFVREAAEEAAAEQYPEMANERERIEETLLEHLHTENTAESLLAEWKVYLRRGDGFAVPDTALLKRRAEEIVSRMSIRRMNLVDIVNRERISAEKATAAAARGDFKKAAEHKGQQVIAHYQWREMRKVIAEKERLERFVAKLNKPTSRQRLGKAHPAFRDVVDSVLDAITGRLLRGVGKAFSTANVPTPQGERLSPFALADIMEEKGERVQFDPEQLQKIIDNPKPWKDRTVGEMRGLYETLLNIAKAASAINNIIVDGKLRDKDAAVEQLIEEGEENLPVHPNKENEATLNLLEKGMSVVEATHALLLRTETMVNMLGGENNLDSMAHRGIMLPLQKGVTLRHDILEKVVKPIIDAMEAIPQDVRKRWNESIDPDALFPQHIKHLKPRKRFELLLMALNRGSYSSIQRLTDGRKISIEQVDKALEMLSREELEWVQSIWDAAQKLWPLARDLEERDTGVAPEAVVHAPFVVQTKDGPVKMRGGYFPLVYDRDLSRVGRRQEVSSMKDLAGVVNRPQTRQGQLKARVEKLDNAPISFDPRAIQAGLIRTAHDIALREPIKSAANLILDPRTQAMLLERLGAKRAKVFEQWIMDVAHMDAAHDPHAPGSLETMRMFKNRLSVSILGHAMDNFMADTTTVLTAPVSTELTAEYSAIGLREFIRNPERAIDFAHENSDRLRRRRANTIIDLQKRVSRIARSQNLAAKSYEWYVDNAFYVAELVDRGTTTAVWTGAYKQAAAKGETHSRAVEFADKITWQVFPSSDTIDKVAIQRSPIFGSFLMFFGYFSVLGQQKATIYHRAYVAKGTMPHKSKEWMKAASKDFALALITSHLAALIMGYGPQPPDDDHDATDQWLEWFVRRLLISGVEPLPFGVSMALEDLFTNKSYGNRPNPGVAFTEEWIKVIKKIRNLTDEDKEQDPVDLAIQVIKAAGITAGAPVTRPLRAAKYINNLMDDDSDVEARGPGDVISGLWYGEYKDRPQTIPKLIEDALE